jgi:hypothetical protein
MGFRKTELKLSWPARQIAINAGEDGAVVFVKIRDNGTYAFGFDAQAGPSSKTSFRMGSSIRQRLHGIEIPQRSSGCGILFRVANAAARDPIRHSVNALRVSQLFPRNHWRRFEKSADFACVTLSSR